MRAYRGMAAVGSVVLGVVVLALTAACACGPTVLSPVTRGSVLGSCRFLSLASFSTLSASGRMYGGSATALSVDTCLLQRDGSASSV